MIAAVRHWSYGAGIPSNVTGSIVFKQESEFDLSEVHIDLGGLERYASGYHVHELPVPMEKCGCLKNFVHKRESRVAPPVFIKANLT